jgi:hypothetical protein
LLNDRQGRRRKVEDIVIEPLGVVARPSSDAAETPGTEVAKAISFIHEQVNFPTWWPTWCAR